MPSKAKRFVVKKPSTGGIIAKSANQIVLLKFRGRYKITVLYYSPDPPVEVLKGVWVETTQTEAVVAH